MSNVVNPNDFVISRKRKKYKFAKFANAENCFELEEWIKDNPLGDKPKDVILEIGAGTGFFSVEMAERYPKKTFVALDVKADRLQKGAYIALENNLSNVYFVRARADQIDQLFSARLLQAIWLTFPDPFPRPRSARRRMTHAIYLEKYADLLGKNGSFCLKHDNPEFFRWSLEQLVSEGWHIDELSFDLHESELSDDYKIMTSYEARWLSEGRITQFVKASRK